MKKIFNLSPPFKALIVDDDPDIADMISNMVTVAYPEKLQVQIQTDPHKALKMSQESPIDIFVIDQLMPEMMGEVLVSKLKEHNPAAFYLMCTGNPSLALAISAKEKGFHGFITKPFSSEDLLEKIDLYLEILLDWQKSIEKQLNR